MIIKTNKKEKYKNKQKKVEEGLLNDQRSYILGPAMAMHASGALSEAVFTTGRQDLIFSSSLQVSFKDSLWLQMLMANLIVGKRLSKNRSTQSLAS